MAFGIDRDLNSPTWLIVEYLQRNGSATIKELEQVLGVTTTAVRQHLNNLQADGYIARETVHSGVGRPHHAYRTTEKARDFFDCHCDDLALTVLEEALQLVGPEQAPALMARVGQRLANRYAVTVQASELVGRVEELALAMGNQGVLTDVVAHTGDKIVLKTYNCPYHELANEYRQICDMEQGMMRQVLGSEVNLSSCIMDGDGGCSFVFTSSPNSSISLEQ